MLKKEDRIIWVAKHIPYLTPNKVYVVQTDETPTRFAHILNDNQQIWYMSETDLSHRKAPPRNTFIKR